MTSYPYHLTITSSVSSAYGILQRGKTDSVCILGFADCDSSYLQSVYRVDDINDALATFTGSASYPSSLIQGMMEAYYTGCRDIYLYPVAPMSEFIAISDRTSSFYVDLLDWYTDALNILAEEDDIDIVVPYDVDIDEGEFITLFVNHCNTCSGERLRLVFVPFNGDATTTYTNEDYHIVLINGTGLFHNTSVFASDYTSNMSASFAGLYSNLATNVPPDNRIFTSPVLFFSDYEDDEETLEANAVVGFRKTVRYKRVYDSSIATTLSYTRAAAGSDFKNLYTVHVIQRLLKAISDLDLIGSAAYLAEDSLQNCFTDFVNKGYAITIDSVYRLEAYTLYVNLIIGLPYPIGDIALNLTIGPLE